MNPAGDFEGWIATLPDTLPVPGDLNGSGLVEQGDLNLVLRLWGAAFDLSRPFEWLGYEPDGLVDQDDLNLVLSRWGTGYDAAPTEMQALPEPAASLGLLAVGALGMRRRQTR